MRSEAYERCSLAARAHVNGPARVVFRRMSKRKPMRGYFAGYTSMVLMISVLSRVPCGLSMLLATLVPGTCLASSPHWLLGPAPDRVIVVSVRDRLMLPPLKRTDHGCISPILALSEGSDYLNGAQGPLDDPDPALDHRRQIGRQLGLQPRQLYIRRCRLVDHRCHLDRNGGSAFGGFFGQIRPAVRPLFRIPRKTPVTKITTRIDTQIILCR